MNNLFDRKLTYVLLQNINRHSLFQVYNNMRRQYKSRFQFGLSRVYISISILKSFKRLCDEASKKHHLL